MKKNIFTVLITNVFLLVLLLSTGCKKAEDVTSSPVKPEVILKESRIKAVHLYNDTVYILNSPFTRQDGEQLIIDEGTIIKAVPGITANGTAGITINPGATILANGSSKNPIIFTSAAATGNQSESWGGLLIKGRAVNNARGAAGDAADNSGIFKYARIEFAALTLDAVGSGTTIENVMVSYTSRVGQDDPLSAFNFYGGSFNCRNLISYACGGPADFYITNGYTGKMQQIIAYRHPFFGGTGSAPYNAFAGVFIENNAGNPADALPVTNPVISNLTIIGPDGQNGSAAVYANTGLANNAALVTTGNTRFQVRNSLILGYPAGAWNLGDSLTGNALQRKESQLSNTVFYSGDTTRTFFVDPAASATFSSTELRSFILQPVLKNQLFSGVADFSFQDPFNYEKLDPLPKSNSPVLKAGDYTGAYFAEPFFIKENYLGALGSDNWWLGWVNATPLKTNYNFPE
ncbi:hypothetical protein QWZ08_14125 [Ferruginibacter paludis]|uniref:hypothetical protein n=1 Tax=Ferruginibacter paludis TaxID=1310417 RepID=UPI0025B424ED|nr:hypothetical protein [Ferruginibacter paludis]MDN3656779.1 hypothetical protein [Ferruginibacter paludis]